MVLQGQDFPLNAIRQQIASGIDIIVQLGRLRDKSRRVLEISEVDGFMGGEIVLHTLYRFEETAVLDSGRIQGFLKKAGTLCHTDKLMAAGLVYSCYVAFKVRKAVAVSIGIYVTEQL